VQVVRADRSTPHANDYGRRPDPLAMMARGVLLAFLVALIGLSAAPTATAAEPPCVVGSSQTECAVSVQMVVCVTDPCDTMDVCVAYGRVCPI
jgi:hypothetical protein